MIIGIIGRGRSGKDTFANMLKNIFKEVMGEDYILMAFADALKRKVAEDFKLTYDQLYGDDKEKPDMRYPKKDTFWTAREILQFIGTDTYRAIDSDFWVNKLIDSIDKNCYNNVIITDIRFHNELKVVDRFCGKTIKIVRENAPKVHGSSHHVSETISDTIDGYDFIVNNSGTLDDLEEVACDLVLKLLST